MNNFKYKSALFATIIVATIGLTACEKPTVVNVPAAPTTETVVVPVAVPGPAGAPGEKGDTGSKGNTGKTGDSTTTVIVTPPAEPTPAN